MNSSIVGLYQATSSHTTVAEAGAAVENDAARLKNLNQAADVKPGKVKTVNGQKAKISASGGSVMIDKAKVVKTDIVGTNGVIHVIDSVILPSS